MQWETFYDIIKNDKKYIYEKWFLSSSINQREIFALNWINVNIFVQNTENNC
jgi:hypothetical protein